MLTPPQHRHVMSLRDVDSNPFGRRDVSVEMKSTKSKQKSRRTKASSSSSSPKLDACLHSISIASFRMDVRHRVFRIVNRKSESGKFRLRLVLSGWNLDLVHVVFSEFSEIKTLDKCAMMSGATPITRPPKSTLDARLAELGEAPFTTVFTSFLGFDLATWCNFREFDSVNGYGPCITTSDTTTSLCLELSVVVKIDKSLKPQNWCQVTMLCTSAVCIRSRELRIPPRCNNYPYYSEVVLPTAISTMQYLSSHRDDIQD